MSWSWRVDSVAMGNWDQLMGAQLKLQQKPRFPIDASRSEDRRPTGCQMFYFLCINLHNCLLSKDIPLKCDPNLEKCFTTDLHVFHLWVQWSPMGIWRNWIKGKSVLFPVHPWTVEESKTLGLMQEAPVPTHLSLSGCKSHFIEHVERPRRSDVS